MESLLQNLESMEQENKALEDHLQKVRQNKMDLLEDLKVAEQDRLGLVKSLQALTVAKGGNEEVGKLSFAFSFSVSFLLLFYCLWALHDISICRQI